ncbi:MAG: hypothetical protein Ct9H300mP8_10320 [Gammaproteobacteria bacterium]|nr:MAG: hypothetical protein Ct9H300mP8_10320 [Gammaproteobacteria bacterium]
MDIQELLEQYEFPSDTPIVVGSALQALDGDKGETRHRKCEAASRNARRIHSRTGSTR